MTRHPLVDGMAVGVAGSFLLAAAVSWAVAYRIFGPRRHPRRHNPKETHPCPST